MTDASTKPCRHCLQAMPLLARVCPVCRSHQGLFSSTRDPRFYPIFLGGFLIALGGFVALMQHLTDDETPARSDQGAGCRGKVNIKEFSYDLRVPDGTGRPSISVRVLIENLSDADVSDPVLRVDIYGDNGRPLDTFHESVYGANVPPKQAQWFRVMDALVAEPSAVRAVKPAVLSARCDTNWR